MRQAEKGYRVRQRFGRPRQTPGPKKARVARRRYGRRPRTHVLTTMARSNCERGSYSWFAGECARAGGMPAPGALFRTAVVVVIVVVKAFIEVVVLLPLLMFGVPPLVDLLVALLALIAKVVRMFAGFFAVSSVVGNRLFPFEFDLLSLFATLGEIIVSVKARGCRNGHKPRNERGGENGFYLKREA